MKHLLNAVRVHRHPYTYGDKKHEEPWKQAVANEVRRHWHGGYLERPVRVSLRFFLARDYDLTGMLESTVNGIAHVAFPPSKKGGAKTKWNHQDEWVYEIAASKELGHAADPGVEITLDEL